MNLKNLTTALGQCDAYNADQRDNIMLIFKTFLSSFSICVSVKYTYSIPQDIHEKYIEEFYTRCLSTSERLYDQLSFSSYEHRELVLDAIGKDIAIISQAAKGDPKTFSFHY